jgi:8-oxo-dGTP pyrophosphatase MutT (NUDIX family)
MEISFRQYLSVAMNQIELMDWQSPLEIPGLNRPQRRPSNLPGDGKMAAVLALFCGHEGSINSDGLPTTPDLLLTQRAIDLTNHAGQVSFPGGRLEPSESSLQAAIREAEEEIGILKSQIEICGQLRSVYIPPSDYTVTPYVGLIRGTPKFTLCQREVKQIIRAPLNQLMAPSALAAGTVIRSNGESLEVPCYQVGLHQIWGATAIMIGELIERLKRARYTATGLASQGEKNAEA